jgi:hypothetical protein
MGRTLPASQRADGHRIVEGNQSVRVGGAFEAQLRIHRNFSRKKAQTRTQKNTFELTDRQSILFRSFLRLPLCLFAAKIP